MSGGGFWIPNNHLMSGVGIDEDPEEAFEYTKITTGGVVPEDRLRAYLDKGPEMLRYVCEHTRLDVVSMPEYPDSRHWGAARRSP